MLRIDEREFAALVLDYVEFPNSRASNREQRWTQSSERRTLVRALRTAGVTSIKPNEPGRHFLATEGCQQRDRSERVRASAIQTVTRSIPVAGIRVRSQRFPCFRA